MRSADDRRTPTSSAAAAAPRLMLRRDVSRSTILDGAWWPRSHDPVVEVSNLVAALEARRIPVAKIMLNPSGWDSHPRRIGVAGRTVRLGWFTTLDAGLLIATTRWGSAGRPAGGVSGRVVGVGGHGHDNGVERTRRAYGGGGMGRYVRPDPGAVGEQVER